jgi:hypothetical protein
LALNVLAKTPFALNFQPGNDLPVEPDSDYFRVGSGFLYYNFLYEKDSRTPKYFCCSLTTLGDVSPTVWDVSDINIPKLVPSQEQSEKCGPLFYEKFEGRFIGDEDKRILKEFSESPVLLMGTLFGAKDVAIYRDRIQVTREKSSSYSYFKKDPLGNYSFS